MSLKSKLHRKIGALAGIAILALAPLGVASAASFSFIAVLNSGQEIQTPKPVSDTQGVALMTLDTRDRMLCYSISYFPPIDDEILAHFHGPASAGQNAGILFDISPEPPGPSPLGSPKTGCVGPLSGKQVSDLKKGLFYINVHSTTFPDGEIRGQVFRMTGAGAGTLSK